MNLFAHLARQALATAPMLAPRMPPDFANWHRPDDLTIEPIERDTAASHERTARSPASSVRRDAVRAEPTDPLPLATPPTGTALRVTAPPTLTRIARDGVEAKDRAQPSAAPPVAATPETIDRLAVAAPIQKQPRSTSPMPPPVRPVAASSPSPPHSITPIATATPLAPQRRPPPSPPAREMRGSAPVASGPPPARLVAPAPPPSAPALRAPITPPPSSPNNAAPEIVISIGRVEVRAAAAPPTRGVRPTPAPPLSLADYLGQRRGTAR